MITVTDTAAKKIQQQLAQRGKGKGLSIGIKTTGCSGLAYTLEYLDDVSDLEPGYTKLYEKFCIYINQKHLPYFKELEIDYVKRGLNEGFEFRNSAEKDRCGCGESFRV
jgi:iron-sulfur cluster assembly protein